MDTFFRFLYEFLEQFFKSFILMFKGIINGIINMFNIKEYISIINFYKDDFKLPEWILVGLTIIIILAIVGGIIFIIYFLIRKYLKFRKTVVEEESLLEEVASLNNQVEEVTGGTISKRVMLFSLAIGVAISLGLAMTRVLCDFSIWWILIPGYSIAIILSLLVQKIFTSIAFFWSSSNVLADIAIIGIFAFSGCERCRMQSVAL